MNSHTFMFVVCAFTVVVFMCFSKKVNMKTPILELISFFVLGFLVSLGAAEAVYTLVQFLHTKLHLS